MNNNFEVLKNEVVKMLENTSKNEKAVLNYINVMFEKFGSKLMVRKNMSIKSFVNLLVNSSTVEDFKEYANRLDINKCYEIESLEGINESIEFNEEYTKDYKNDIQGYEEYKAFLDSRIKFNDNLYVMEYK